MVCGGIYPPGLPCSQERLIYSVDVSLPAEADDELRRYAMRDHTSWAAAVSQALDAYRQSVSTPPDKNARNVAWAIHQMQELCPPQPVQKLSARRQERLRRRTEEEISELRAGGEIGNVILSRELYEFVRDKVEAGVLGSPTEVVIAAIPFLRAE